MKIVYNFKKCIGCGLCVSACPAVWSWGQDGQARLNNPARIENDWEAGSYPDQGGLAIAAENCPAGAIKLEE